MSRLVLLVSLLIGHRKVNHLVQCDYSVQLNAVELNNSNNVNLSMEFESFSSKFYILNHF